MQEAENKQSTTTFAEPNSQKTPARQAAPKARKSSANKGESYGCDACGLVVMVQEDCGCTDTCDILCCGQPMKKRAPRQKSSTKAK